MATMEKIINRKYKKFKHLNLINNDDKEQFYVLSFKDNFIKISVDDAEEIYKQLKAQSIYNSFANTISK